MGWSSQDLELLVEELTKQRPNFDKVKVLSKKCGLRYHEDVVEQMQVVLNAIAQQTTTLKSTVIRSAVKQVSATKLKNIEGV